MPFKFFQVPVDQYHTAGAFLYWPDVYDANGTKLYQLIVSYGGKGTAGTDANKLATDPPTSFLKAGKTLAAINPVTGVMEDSLYLIIQDKTGAPWPKAVDYALNFLRGTSKLTINGTVFQGEGLKVDPRRIVHTGLSYGGASCVLAATWDEVHAKNARAVLSVAPMGDVTYTKSSWHFAAEQDVKFWFVTGSADGFLANANAVTAGLQSAGGTAVSQVIPGQGHSAAVWNAVYNGTQKITWVVNGQVRQLDWLEWFLACTTDAPVVPPVDPEEPEEQTYTPTMERGTWVTLRRIGEPAGTVYRGQVLDFDAETGKYDVFNYGHAVTVVAGTPDAPGSTGYYYEPAETIL